MMTDTTSALPQFRSSSFRTAFTRPRTFLPQEHGGWFLFLAPLAVGLAVGGTLNGGVLVFVLAALAVFLLRQPLDLAVKALRNQRSRADLPALAAWMIIEGLVIASAGGYLVLGAGYLGLLPIGLLGAGFLATQVWASQARQARTAWSEVVGTAGLSLTAGAGYYVASGDWSSTGLALWLLCTAQGVGGVLYSRWRLRRRRLAAKDGGTGDVPRASIWMHFAGALGLAVLLAGFGWAPWAVVPLYATLLIRVLRGTRHAAPPDASVKAIGLGEGLATIIGAAWLVAAFVL
jgi:hypothetical protein